MATNTKHQVHSWNELFAQQIGGAGLGSVKLGRACLCDVIISIMAEMENLKEATTLTDKAFYPLFRREWYTPLKQLYEMATCTKFSGSSERRDVTEKLRDLFTCLEVARLPSNRFVPVYDSDRQRGKKLGEITLNGAKVVLLFRVLETRLRLCLATASGFKNQEDWTVEAIQQNWPDSPEGSVERFVDLCKQFIGDYEVPRVEQESDGEDQEDQDDQQETKKRDPITAHEKVKELFSVAKQTANKQREEFTASLSSRNFGQVVAPTGKQGTTAKSTGKPTTYVPSVLVVPTGFGSSAKKPIKGTFLKHKSAPRVDVTDKEGWTTTTRQAVAVETEELEMPEANQS
jgi:hypothetical protein